MIMNSEKKTTFNWNSSSGIKTIFKYKLLHFGNA